LEHSAVVIFTKSAADTVTPGWSSPRRAINGVQELLLSVPPVKAEIGEPAARRDVVAQYVGRRKARVGRHVEVAGLLNAVLL